MFAVWLLGCYKAVMERLVLIYYVLFLCHWGNTFCQIICETQPSFSRIVCSYLAELFCPSLSQLSSIIIPLHLSLRYTGDILQMNASFYQRLTSLLVKTAFLTYTWNFLCCKSCLLSLILSPRISKKSLASSFPCPLIKQL